MAPTAETNAFWTLFSHNHGRDFLRGRCHGPNSEYIWVTAIGYFTKRGMFMDEACEFLLPALTPGDPRRPVDILHELFEKETLSKSKKDTYVKKVKLLQEFWFTQ